MEANENDRPANALNTESPEKDLQPSPLSIRCATQKLEHDGQETARLRDEEVRDLLPTATLQQYASQALESDPSDRKSGTTSPLVSPVTPTTPATDPNGKENAPLPEEASPSLPIEPAPSAARSPNHTDTTESSYELAEDERARIAQRCNEALSRRPGFARVLFRLLKRRMYAKTRRWDRQAEQWPGTRPRNSESLELRHKVWFYATLERMKFEALSLRQHCIESLPHGHSGDELRDFFVWLQILGTCGGDVRLCQTQLQEEAVDFDEEGEESDYLVESDFRRAAPTSDIDMSAAGEEPVYTDEDIESYIQ